VLHAYLPATEPYDRWEGLERTSDEYQALKTARAEPLWEAIERFIPDIRARRRERDRHAAHARALPAPP
jgi:hypothetical protein